MRYCRKVGAHRAPNCKKEVLTERHRRLRIGWVRTRKFWTVNDWKKVIFSDVVYVSICCFNELKGNLTIYDIEKLNEKLKSFKIGEHNEARNWAKIQKEIYNSKTKFDIRFKIDSKNQRRIQCALKIETIYQILQKDLNLKYNKLQIKDISSTARIRKTNN